VTAEQEQRLLNESGRGARARRLLEDDLLKEAIATVEADILEKWKSSPVRDQEGQLALRLKWQCLHEIRTCIADVAVTGKMADKTLEAERTIRQRAKDALREFKR
jgi:hypothetical protein